MQYLKYLDQLEAMFERDKEVEEYKKDVRILQSKLKKTRKQVGVNFYYIWYRQPDMWCTVLNLKSSSARIVTK